MAILYIASESFELEPLAQVLTAPRKLKWPVDYAVEGLWEGRRVLLAANGAGPKLAMQAVEVAIRSVTAAELSASKLELVISTGLCGALSPDLRECQIVIAECVLDLANMEEFECVPVVSDQPCVYGKLLTQDRVAGDSDEKAGLSARGIAVDMEAAGVARRTARAGLPFACIKAVSDRLDESFGFDLNKMRTIGGRISRGKISYYALAHPKVVPELLRLRRRANNAAKALGEFLVSCRITAGQNSPSAE